MRPHVRDFVKIINAIDQSKRRSEVFIDFCELAYCALAKVTSPSKQQRDDLETQYMQVVARYRNKDDIRKMPELLAMVIETIPNGGLDYLGEIAGELGALDAKLGQFFTPYEISRMMAEIALTGVDAIIAENGFVTIQEPAVGAGGMVLAAADVIEGLGFCPETQLWVEATELSRGTYHMGYIQINARGVAGKITCGNSLTAETYTSAFTAAAPLFYAANGDPFAKQRAAAVAQAARQTERDVALQSDRAERLKTLVTTSPTTGAIQLGLFD